MTDDKSPPKRSASHAPNPVNPVKARGSWTPTRDAAGNRAPNWAEWQFFEELALWECVALSLNIDPLKARSSSGYSGYSDPTFNEPEEFKRRLSLARRKFNAFDAFDKVKTADFAEFAILVSWSLPDDFPGRNSATASSNQDTKADGDKLQTKRRNSYLLIIDALLRSANIDPNARGIAVSIQQMLNDHGSSLDEKVIRDILKEIPDALASRQK